jgi:hypothetical protein
VRWADHLLAEVYPKWIPRCVVPACDRLAPQVFVADEHGKLAGRWWAPGDEIRLCPEHGLDVYRAAHAYGIEQLAEWIRPDANLDALDGYDVCNDSLFSDQIYRQRGRGLRARKVQP